LTVSTARKRLPNIAFTVQIQRVRFDLVKFNGKEDVYIVGNYLFIKISLKS